MLKAVTLGLGAWLAIAPSPGSSLTNDLAQVTLAPLVTDICPVATWAAGFRIGETVPLAPHQYHQAVVISTTPLRAGYGFEGDVITH